MLSYSFLFATAESSSQTPAVHFLIAVIFVLLFVVLPAALFSLQDTKFRIRIMKEQHERRTLQQESLIRVLREASVTSQILQPPPQKPAVPPPRTDYTSFVSNRRRFLPLNS